MSEHLSANDLILDACCLVAKIEIDEMADYAYLDIITDEPGLFTDRPATNENLYRALHKIALSLAWMPDCKLPIFLLESEVFRDFYEDEARFVWMRELERREDEEYAQDLIRKKQKLVAVNEMISREAWDELNLPTPESLCEYLLSGKSITVDQHFLVFDEGLTCYTNPYGCDGYLSDSEPTVAMMRSFLKTIARGGMYGPEPY